MSDKNEIERINTWLIKQLLSIPFPYGETLKEQTDAALLAVTATPSHYCVHFQLPASVNTLPDWLDAMPLSWQYLVEGAPVLCQLFVKEGYLARLELVDFTLDPIRWDQIWTANPLLDFEYSIHQIRNHLAHKDLVLNKVLHIGRSIDLSLEISGNRFVASFRGCRVRKLMPGSLPATCHFRVLDSTANAIAVASNAADIDFDCELCFIQRHKLID